MIPTEVYELACALEAVLDDPCEEAISAAWLIIDRLRKAGFDVTRTANP